MKELKETTWNYVQGEPTGTFYSAEKKWINRMHKLKRLHPDEVDIVVENKDGSVVVHLPPYVAKFSFPKVVSEKNRQAARERMKNIQAKKNQKNGIEDVEDDEDLDDTENEEDEDENTDEDDDNGN